MEKRDISENKSYDGKTDKHIFSEEPIHTANFAFSKAPEDKYKRSDEVTKNSDDYLRDRPKADVSSLKDQLERPKDDYYERTKYIRDEIDKEVKRERDRLESIHKSDLSRQEESHKRILEKQKEYYEEQNENYKRQLSQLVELNKLATKVENTSSQINGLTTKVTEDREKALEERRAVLERKEIDLTEKENKLKIKEKNMDDELKHVHDQRRELEIRDNEKRKEWNKELERIRVETTKLKELQAELSMLEYNVKQKLQFDKDEMMVSLAVAKEESDKVRNEYLLKMKALESERSALENNKKYFEKYKDEITK